MTTALAAATMAVGVVLILRGAVIIASGTTGRFPLDPWLSLVGGFALIFLGRAALDLIG